MVQALTGAHLDPFLRKVSILGVTLHLRKFHEIVQVKTADYRTRETEQPIIKFVKTIYMYIFASLTELETLGWTRSGPP